LHRHGRCFILGRLRKKLGAPNWAIVISALNKTFLFDPILTCAIQFSLDAPPMFLVSYR
jgi:hypothetical protein